MKQRVFRWVLVGLLLLGLCSFCACYQGELAQGEEPRGEQSAVAEPEGEAATQMEGEPSLQNGDIAFLEELTDKNRRQNTCDHEEPPPLTSAAGETDSEQTEVSVEEPAEVTEEPATEELSRDLPPSETEGSGNRREGTGSHYVLNTNTEKFHYPSCESVEQIKEENRWDFNGTREEILAMGYVPCKNCNP